MRPYLASATVATAPVPYGAGIQNKVLEALACGTPVVATPRAVAALQVKPGEQVLVGDGPVAFAEAILRLLRSAELRARLGRAGRRYVEQNHDWGTVASRLERVYQETISGYHRRRQTAEHFLSSPARRES
jgi:glycosyltransferase involved in cell wall biosynthesis